MSDKLPELRELEDNTKYTEYQLGELPEQEYLLKGGKYKKRVSKRKTNKRKTNKRKTNKRKTNKRKTIK